MEKEEKKNSSAVVNLLPIQVLLFFIITIIAVLINYSLNMKGLLYAMALGDVSGGGLSASLLDFIVFEGIVAIVFGISCFIISKSINNIKSAHRFLKIEIVLLIILIISLVAAIYIYNSDEIINKLVTKVQTSKGILVSQNEKDRYNAPLLPYINEGIKGSEVKSMLDEIIEQNQSNVGEEGKFIGVKVKKSAINNYNEETKLLQACEKASTYNSTDGTTIVPGENNENAVNAAEKLMIKLRNTIKNEDHFSVSCNMSQGYITWIYIEKAN